MMRVVDLRREQDFDDACRKLCLLVKSKNRTVDLVVSVETGGRFVGEKFVEFYNPGMPNFVVKRQRKGTKTKQKYSIFSRMIGIMPDVAHNLLRVVEHHARQFFYERKNRRPRISNVEIVNDISGSVNEESMILIIDDAVDSGSTLLDVISFVKQRYPNSEIQTCAITITFKNPIVKVDYHIYKDTLVKFPWSMDSKHERGAGSSHV